MTCAGERGSSPTPTTPGPKSSWRLARRGLPVRRCGTPRARRSSNSGVTTTSSSNWWPTCPWRSTVSKNGYPSACRRRRYQRMSAFEKTTVLARVASSTLPKRQVLKDLGVPKSTYYRWLTREQRCQGLENQPGGGLAPWNRPLSQPEEQAVLTVARRAPELSCRQLAAWITDNQGFSVSESTVYRILRREGLVKSPEMQLKPARSITARPPVPTRCRQPTPPTSRSSGGATTTW